MNLPFGLQLTRRKNVPEGYQSIESTRGWFRIISEPFTGAWQRNIVRSHVDVLTFAANYRCITLKATDIAKLHIKLVQRDSNGVWTELVKEHPAYSPVLRKPNHFQTRIQFIEQWMVSKFIHGKAFILKKRNNRGGTERGNVDAMYVLDPDRVSVKVAPGGDVYYSLSADNLSDTEATVVPAREIIHDVMTPLFHPLCGISPISACALAAMQGLRVQQNSEAFFGNGSMPSGIVEMPDEIDDDQQKEIEDKWAENFSGNNVGRVAVLGAGTKFTPLTIRAVDAQLIEQLKWTSENCCTAHGVPPYKVGVGPMPTYNNIEALNQQYYSEALQINIESAEALLDEGLGLPADLGVEFDLDGLFRADTVQRTTAAERAIKSGMKIDEVRSRFFDLGPVPGGDTVYLQQQNFSLEALAKRDASDDPFGTKQPDPPAPKPPTAEAPEKTIDVGWIEKGFLSGLGRVA